MLCADGPKVLNLCPEKAVRHGLQSEHIACKSEEAPIQACISRLEQRMYDPDAWHSIPLGLRRHLHCDGPRHGNRRPHRTVPDTHRVRGADGIGV